MHYIIYNPTEYPSSIAIFAATYSDIGRGEQEGFDIILSHRVTGRNYEFEAVAVEADSIGAKFAFTVAEPLPSGDYDVSVFYADTLVGQDALQVRNRPNEVITYMNIKEIEQYEG